MFIQALDEDEGLCVLSSVRSPFSQDWMGFQDKDLKRAFKGIGQKEKLTDIGFIRWLFTGLDKIFPDDEWFWILDGLIWINQLLIQTYVTP